jgi:capsular polysaccharide export protein
VSVRRIGVLSRGMLRIPALGVLAGASIVPLWPGLGVPRGLDAIAGWGFRPTSARARRLAARHGLPYLAFEDGFLRSVGLGGEEPPLSLVEDDLGIYYDASRASRLERLVAPPLEAPARERARALVAAWRRERVSKYNGLRDHAGALPEHFVLAFDQTRGDASIVHGLADERSFARMLEAALDENPRCSVVLKTHPDVFAGKTAGYLGHAARQAGERLQLLADNVHPAALLERCEAVYAVTSQAGFEGLLWGKPVRTFGMPFYAGWGLTRDELPAPARRVSASLEQLVHAALVAYARYVDPDSGAPCEVERVLAHLGLQRRMHARFPPQLHAIGLSPWKRRLARDFLRGSQLRFHRHVRQAPPDATLVVWGRAAVDASRHVIRLEDGFLRSVGLGAALVRPLSWVADDTGIYYDATRASALEGLLQTQAFDAPLRARAAELRARIVSAGISKYNLGEPGGMRPAAGAPVVLVVGQVESDAAVALGAAGVRSNAELVAAARAARPGAWLVYKPHPDVVAGLRRPGSADRDPRAAGCDEVVTGGSIVALLDAADEVHVISSLAGFEALLRGRRVVCHGLPFYAGWGLTEDRVDCARRTRRLALDELVAGALILYPAYLGRDGRHFCTAEQALVQLESWRERRAGVAPGWRQRLWLAALRLRARCLG